MVSFYRPPGDGSQVRYDVIICNFADIELFPQGNDCTSRV